LHRYLLLETSLPKALKKEVYKSFTREPQGGGISRLTGKAY